MTAVFNDTNLFNHSEFKSTIFTADILEQFEAFAFEDNDNHGETGAIFMNKFHYVVLHNAIVKNL